MAELGMVDSLDDEQRQELDAIERGTADLERQIRAATVAVEDEDAEQRTETRTHEPDAEQRERIGLRSKAQLTNYLLAAAQGRMVAGAEAELQAAAGVKGIPIQLWDVPETRAQGDGRETRDITPAPGTVGVNLDPIRPAVFANSIAARLGIDMPRVASGTYATATITTSQTAEAKAKSAAVAATAGAFTLSTATPKRVSARLELTLEDIAAVGQANFESILRENLSLALSDELDDQAINGAGQNNDLNGMFKALTDPAAPAAGVRASTPSLPPSRVVSTVFGQTLSATWPSLRGWTPTSCQRRCSEMSARTTAIAATSALPTTPRNTSAASGRTSGCRRRRTTSSRPSCTAKAGP